MKNPGLSITLSVFDQKSAATPSGFNIATAWACVMTRTFRRTRRHLREPWYRSAGSSRNGVAVAPKEFKS